MKRGIRFGLGSLLLVMTVFALLLGLWSSVVRPYAEQQQAIAALRKAGAEVEAVAATGSEWRRWLVQTVLGGDAFVRATVVVWQDQPLPEDFAARLATFGGLEELLLDRTDFSDTDVRSLRGMTYLTQLSLRYTEISDRSAGFLAGLTGLKRLRLTGTALGDEGLARLAPLPGLQELYVRWTEVTPRGAEAFRAAAPGCRLHSHTLD